MSNPLLEATLLAECRADEAHNSAHAHLRDIGTAESPLSALGSASAYVDCMRQVEHYRRVAEVLRAMAVRGEG